MSTFHAIVWMDHQEAHVVMFDREHVEAQRIHSRSHHKHQGKAVDAVAFYQSIVTALKGTHEVLLTGPGLARHDFRTWCTAHEPVTSARIVDSITTDHPSDAQLAALARQYFKKFDAMESDPSQVLFHFAFHVTDLDEARRFYGDLLGCKEGRSTATWVDFDFFSHQISLHLGEPFKTSLTGRVGEHLVPMPHFGLILQKDDWQTLADRLQAAQMTFVIAPHLRFAGQPGEQWTMFFMDPFGNPIEVKGFASLDTRRARVIVREILIAFGLLLAFMFVGQSFLQAMSLSDVSLQIGGALVLFLIALRMVFPPPEQDTPVQMAEPLIVPLAIPALAGPSALATVLLLVSQAPDRRLEWVAALCVTMLVCAVVLLLAERLQRLVGLRVVSAFERLMGLILVSISVEMLIRGLKSLAQSWPH
eukprot:gene1711-1677_t